MALVFEVSDNAGLLSLPDRNKFIIGVIHEVDRRAKRCEIGARQLYKIVTCGF